MMDLEGWLKEYRRICKELGLSQEADREARDIAARLMEGREQPLRKLESLVRSHDVMVFGAGPSLPEGVLALTQEQKRMTLIAADGAASCLLESGIFPSIVVTDLDGKKEDLLLADRFGSVMVVHAHGDNIPALKSLLPRMRNAVATTQVEPVPSVHNFFGFTDGDRAVLLARRFGARSVELIGFDFGELVGKYSDPKDPTDHEAPETKKKKLEIAKRLIG